ncbi:class I SAM-dependent DNA methyltransferase [Geodermatophilus sp. SYSU D00697]
MANEALRAHWASVGGNYTAEWQPPARARLGERELDFVVAALQRSAARTALDVGIGSGRILSALLERTETTEFYGIDIAEAMVEATRNRLAGEERLRDLRVCDLSSEPLPFDRTFDFISAIRMLKYNEDWRDMVGKLATALSPDGVLVFTMTNSRSLNRFAREYAVPYESTTRSELEELARTLGLDVLDVAGFTKLPHRVYSGVRSPRLAKGLLAVDATLDRVVGSTTFAREIFVAAQRR